MHHVLSPRLTFLVEWGTSWFGSQLGSQDINMFGISLKKVCFLEVFQIYVSEVPALIVNRMLKVCTVSLRLMIIVAGLSRVVISRYNLRECVTLFEPTIHPSTLVSSVIEVTIRLIESKLRRL